MTAPADNYRRLYIDVFFLWKGFKCLSHVFTKAFTFLRGSLSVRMPPLAKERKFFMSFCWSYGKGFMRKFHMQGVPHGTRRRKKKPWHRKQTDVSLMAASTNQYWSIARSVHYPQRWLPRWFFQDLARLKSKGIHSFVQMGTKVHPQMAASQAKHSPHQPIHIALTCN